MKEDKFLEQIYGQLLARQSELGKFGDQVEIKTKIKILKDVTVVPEKSTFNIVFGYAQQDIVIYSKNKIPPIEHVIHVKSKEAREIIVPLVIFEVKIGKEKGLTSHAIETYSHIAREIKDKFPFVMYNFVIQKSDKRNETLWRHGKHFDRILIESELYKLTEKMINITKEHLDDLTEKDVL